MNVVIIEDETLTAQRLEDLLHEYDSTIQVLARLPSVAKAVQWFTHQPTAHQPDLIFMDIHLDDGTGFNIIDHLKLEIPIIFTTAYDSYAIQAFKTNSIDYLLKPINEVELAVAINKFKRNWQKQEIVSGTHNVRPEWLGFLEKSGKGSYKDRFMVTLGPRIRSIDVAQIAYFFYEDKTTYLTTQDGQHLVVEYSLDKLVSLLDPHRFFRVNRAYLVALPAIYSIHTYSVSKLKLELLPTPRHEVIVSTDRLSDFKAWLGK